MDQSDFTRLIICVDGTWCNPDGPYGQRDANITNVYRLFTCVKKGVFRDSSGKSVNQRKFYFKGIGSDDDISLAQRVRQGIHGNQCLAQIQEVYKQCCRLTEPDDEIWLYGFSRGAWVVRAVAGLLHYLQALSSAEELDPETFNSDYKQALRVYEKLQKNSKLGEGQIHDLLSARTRPAPTVKFVGVFDSVKEVNDKSLYDISFNDSIQHLRHALALNEDREKMTPQYIYPNFSNRTRSLLSRTFVQAWFVGAHIDMGGSCESDGLSLYPLQWMLLESRAIGLFLEFDGTFGGRSALANPLEIVGLLDENEAQLWSCKTENELTVRMQDIRHLHSLEGPHGERYAIHLNRRGKAWQKMAREPFDSNGNLNGYCSFGMLMESAAPQGTIIHPSVYLLLDEYAHVSLDVKFFPCHNFLEQARYRMLGQIDGLPQNLQVMNQGFWNDREVVIPQDIGAIRILVCGNTGVGKSSLINKIFGVEVTQSSDRERGIHNVKEEIIVADRPDLIIHDSGGFEAGGLAEIEAIEFFLKEKSEETDIEKRLHVIWFCLETNSSRTKQTAAEHLFKAISKHAEDVPIVIVATKKDEFHGAKMIEKQTMLRKNREPVTLEAINDYAERCLQQRLADMEQEMTALEGGRFDAFVAVEINDDESIETLTGTTAQCFSHEKVRLLYVRAQVTRIDLKIDLALGETMRIYKRIVRSSVSTAGLPGAATVNRVAAAIDVCRSIITCFGIPSLSAKTAFEICKANLSDDFGNSVSTGLAEVIAIVNTLTTIGTGGLPFFLLTMATNPLLIVPATTRLFLMLACDLILIFTRSFRESSIKCVGQPNKRDVETAASAYRLYCKEVHKRVMTLVPKRNIIKSFRIDQVRLGINEIVQEYKGKVVEGIGAEPAPYRNNYSRTSISLRRTSTGSDTIAEDMEDIKKVAEDIRNIDLTKSSQGFD